jgi:hypothetical protein
VASYNKFNSAAADLPNGVHNLGTDSLKVGLFSTAPAATDTAYNSTNGTLVGSGATEIAAGNGYTAGGAAVPIASSTQTGGTYKLMQSGNVVFTASGAGFGPFRYIAFYNSSKGTTAARPVLGWWDYGSSISVSAGNTFSISFDGVNGILTLV